MKLIFILYFLVMQLSVVYGQTSFPQQCRDAGGTVDVTGHRNRTALARCLCRGERFNPAERRCSAEVRAVSQSECSSVIGSTWRMQLPNCVCQNDPNITLDPQAPAFRQSLQHCRNTDLLRPLSTSINRLATVNNPPQVCEEGQNACPSYLRQFLYTDNQGFARPFMRTRASPNDTCRGERGVSRGRLRTAEALEQFLNGQALTAVSHPTNVNNCLPEIVANNAAADSTRSFHVAEYYYLMNRIKRAAAKHLDEIAAIDAALGRRSSLNGVSCSFSSFREVEQSCQRLKGNCASATSSIPRLSELTSVAEETLAPIRTEISGLRTRIASIRTQSNRRRELIGTGMPSQNQNISSYGDLQELERKLAEEERKAEAITLPWMKGNAYKSTYNRGRGQVNSAIEAQFSDNRTKLLERLEALKRAASCLNDGQAPRSKCRNFEDVIEHYTEDFDLPTGESAPRGMRDVAAEFDRVRCYRDQRAEIRAARSRFNQAASSAVLVGGSVVLAFLTGGTGNAALAAAAPRLAASGAFRTVVGTSIAATELGALGIDVTDVRRNCSATATHRMGSTDVDVSVTGRGNENSNTCNQNLRYAEATNHYASCATSWVMAVSGVGGMAGASRAVRSFARNTDENLALNASAAAAWNQRIGRPLSSAASGTSVSQVDMAMGRIETISESIHHATLGRNPGAQRISYNNLSGAEKLQNLNAAEAAFRQKVRSGEIPSSEVTAYEEAFRTLRQRYAQTSALVVESATAPRAADARGSSAAPARSSVATATEVNQQSLIARLPEADRTTWRTIFEGANESERAMIRRALHEHASDPAMLRRLESSFNEIKNSSPAFRQALDTLPEEIGLRKRGQLAAVFNMSNPQSRAMILEQLNNKSFRGGICGP